MTLDLDRRHTRYGTTIREHIDLMANELSIDAVGLHQIIPTGEEGFGLTGPELHEYIRLSIAELMRRGARPVVGSNSLQGFIVRDCGADAGEVATNLIKEWIAGKEPVVTDTTWFATPDQILMDR